MSDVFKKLNLKEQKEIVIINAPQSFEGEVAQLKDVSVKRSLEDVAGVTFLLAYVTKMVEVHDLLPRMAPKLVGDAVMWFAYPKGTSKKYQCDFNRDSLWQVLEPLGYRPVRMVAIDEDWSGFRFKRSEYVKK